MNDPDLSWLYLAPASRPKHGRDGPPPPPYHLESAEILTIGVEFDSATIERTLPAALRAIPERTGGFGILTVGAGWGIAPYTASFAWIDVEGHDSSDGGKGRFHAGGYLSGDCFEAFLRYYRNSRIDLGSAKISGDSGLVTGSSGPSGDRAVRYSLRHTGEVEPAVSGVNYYIHADEQDSLCINSAAYTIFPRPCEVVEVEITASPNAPFGQLQPKRTLWASHATGSLTHSEPKSLAVPPGGLGDQQSTRMVVLSVLSQLGRAAFLVGTGGRLILANQRARDRLGGVLGVAGGKLVANRKDDQQNVERILSAALSSGSERLQMEVVVLEEMSGASRLVVQAIPVPSQFEAPAAVLLVSDPTEPGSADIADSLQLFGLTGAEARAASAVGMGLSHREAAEKIGVSEGTIRVTLTHVYSKLGVSRASELASLVGRLSAINAHVPTQS